MTAAKSSGPDLLSLPRAQDYVCLDHSPGPLFMVTIDTEEEFDWNAPLDRASRAVTILDAIEKAQDYFERAGVRPLYLTDFPVIDDDRVGPMLAAWVASDRADVGAHCHPWVNPPHTEEVNNFNSFHGNLPEEWEREKLTVLRDRIADMIGQAPRAFRAGRYGAGPNTARILCDLGFTADMSVRARYDYSGQNGPDFSAFPVVPYWLDTSHSLIELPLSTAFTGPLRRWGEHLVPSLERRSIAGGVLARTGLFQRVPLTPEGVSATEAIRAVDRLLADGLRLLMFSFHSPTLAPGNTPYVRNAADLEGFYHWWDKVLGHLARRGVKPAGMGDVLAACGL